ncbi:hypothetical protein KAR91_65900 [Candidatus Pacearchaeota archaeon]|nr:hypothetical protein [Candidatus Pacearchaeota archaeon]
MKNKYLDSEVGATKFNNFFHKLEHSISIAHIHGIISDSEYSRCKHRLENKFLSSLKKGDYKNVSPGIDVGDLVKLNKGDVIELIHINKTDKEITFSFEDGEYDMRFDFMLNFEPVPAEG